MVEGVLTKIQYTIANKTEPFATRTPIPRYCFFCLSGRSVRSADRQRRDKPAHQHLRKIIFLFELVADNLLQGLYGVRLQQVRLICRKFWEHFPAYLRGGIVFEHGDSKRLCGDVYTWEADGKVCGTEDGFNDVSQGLCTDQFSERLLYTSCMKSNLIPQLVRFHILVNGVSRYIRTCRGLILWSWEHIIIWHGIERTPDSDTCWEPCFDREPL